MSTLYVMQGDGVTTGLFRINKGTGAWTQVGTSNWVNTKLMTPLGSDLYVMQGDNVNVGLFRVEPVERRLDPGQHQQLDKHEPDDRARLRFGSVGSVCHARR